MIKRYFIMVSAFFMLAGCSYIEKKLDLREPTCLEKVDIGVKTQKTLADTAIAMHEIGAISTGAAKEVAKSITVTVSLTDSAETLCKADKEDLAAEAMGQAKKVYQEVCAALQLEDKTYCKVLEDSL